MEIEKEKIRKSIFDPDYDLENILTGSTNIAHHHHNHS